jgi:glutamine amidotransferase
MQLMCKHSAENDTNCLGIFEEQVMAFKATENTTKVPQIGWNTITNLKTELFNGVSENSFAYFVHGYYAPLSTYTIAECHYPFAFSAALEKDNFMACQFHPEKSGPVGEEVLKRFLNKGQ